MSMARTSCGQVRDLGIESVEAVESARLFLPRHRGLVGRRAADRPGTPDRPHRRAVPRGHRLAAAGATAAPVVVVRRKPGVMDPVAISTLRAVADMGLAAAPLRHGPQVLLLGQAQPGRPGDDRRGGPRQRRASRTWSSPTRRRMCSATPRPTSSTPITVPLLAADDEGLKAISRAGRPVPERPRDADHPGPFPQAGPRPDGCRTGVPRPDVVGALRPQDVPRASSGSAAPTAARRRSTISSRARSPGPRRNWPGPGASRSSRTTPASSSSTATQCVCFKVETHNHPSALEPYGGAATGIGGVIRDPLGTGMGAKPILNTDVFCFAPPDYPGRPRCRRASSIRGA